MEILKPTGQHSLFFFLIRHSDRVKSTGYIRILGRYDRSFSPAKIISNMQQGFSDYSQGSELFFYLLEFYMDPPPPHIHLPSYSYVQPTECGLVSARAWKIGHP